MEEHRVLQHLITISATRGEPAEAKIKAIDRDIAHHYSAHRLNRQDFADNFTNYIHP
jgi:hypothetical protein